MSASRRQPVIFLAFANDRGDDRRYLRNLPREAAEVREILDRGEDHDLWEVVERPNATLDDIIKVFQDARYRGRIVAFHFGGHGDSNELMLETQSGDGASTNASVFLTFLRHQESLRLVFLNGCSTQGHVRNLLATGVPAVIATSRQIDDDVATNFAVNFYRGLSGGAGLAVAFDEAVASQMAGGERSFRAIHRKDAVVDDRWPWELHVRDGATSIREWSLGEAAGQPLLGLPSLPPIDLPLKPYRHLNWFAREHAPIFFGRGREIRELFERLTSRHTPPITLLYGQSGVGKSSLLAAGLLPRLGSAHTTKYVRRDRNVGLGAALRDAVGARPSTSLRESWRQQEQSTGRPLIVLLDQIEEVFTRAKSDDPNELSDFTAELRDVFVDSAARPDGKLLLGFRKEWLADIEDPLVRLMIPHGKVFVDHLDAAGIAEAISGPATDERLRGHYRLTIEEGLAARIAADLIEDRGSPIAPALQLLLTKLWDRAVAHSPEAPRFTRDLYTQLKREGVLLDDFLEQQLAALAAWQPELARSGLFLDVLAEHTTIIGSARPRNWTELENLYAPHLGLLPELVARARDLTLLVDAVDLDGSHGDDAVTRLVHDAVAQLVRRRFDQSDLPGQHARRLLERRARGWTGTGTGDTLDEAELAAVEAGGTGMRTWTPDEARLVEASVAERARNAEQRRVATVIRALTSSREAQDDPLVGALLLAELADLPEPDETIGTAIRVAQRAFPRAAFDAHEQPINSIAFSPDGALVGTGSDDGTARIWWLDGSRPCVVLSEHSDAVTCIAFSPDGQLLATASLDGVAMLHRVDQSSRPHALFGHGGVVSSIMFSADGRRVVTTSTDGTARVWMRDEPESQQILAGHHGGVRSATFNSSATELLTVDDQGTARVWDLATGAVTLNSADTSVAAAVYTADDRVVLDLADGQVHIWPPERGASAQPQVLSDAIFVGRAGGNNTPVLAAARSAPRIAYSTASDALLVHDLHEPVESWRKPSDETIRAAGTIIRSAELDTNGTCLLARCSDGTARLWLLSKFGPLAQTLSHGASGIRAATLSLDGRHVATAAADGSVRIWAAGYSAQPRLIARTRHAVVRLVSAHGIEVVVEGESGDRDGATGLVETIQIPIESPGAATVVDRRIDILRYSADRTRLMASFRGQLVVLDAAPAASPIVIAGDICAVQACRFVGDGSRLLVHVADGTLNAWDLTRGEVEWRRRDTVEAIASADGAIVVAIAADHVARLIDVASGETIWRQNGVARAEFVPATAGTASWVRLHLEDGRVCLRSPDGSDTIVTLSEARQDEAADTSTLWISASDGWIAHLRADAASLVVYSIARPDDTRVIATEIKWVSYVEQRGLFLVLLRNGELRSWKTARWRSESPSPEGSALIETGVAQIDVAPNAAHVAIHSENGTLTLFDFDAMEADREFANVVGCAWNADGSWLATWARHPAGAPLVADRPVDRDWQEVLALHAVAVEPRGAAIDLGQMVSTLHPPRWLDVTHVAAPVARSGEPAGSVNLAIWNVGRAPIAQTDPVSPSPLLLGRPFESVAQAVFAPADRAWAYFDAFRARWMVESLTEQPDEGLTKPAELVATALNATTLSRVSMAFGGRNRMAVAHTVAGIWWVYIEQLDPSIPPVRLAATGFGAVDDITFAADAASIDVRLRDGTSLSIPLDGSCTHVWPTDASRFVYAEASEGGSVALVTSDGTARYWPNDREAPLVHLSAPGGRITVLGDPYWCREPAPTLVVGPPNMPWIAVTLDDGSCALWAIDDAGNTHTLAVPGRRIVAAIDTSGIFRPYRIAASASWIAAPLDDGTACVWRIARLSSPEVLAVPGRRIERLQHWYGDAFAGTLDDGSQRKWRVRADAVELVSPEEPPPRAHLTSRDGRYAVRVVGARADLVRLDAPTTATTLSSEAEELGDFAFSADGNWLVATVTEPGENNPWALRIWNVDTPDASRLLPNTELIHAYHNFLHIRRSGAESEEIIPFSETDEPLVVGRNAVVLWQTVMYVARAPDALGVYRPTVHIVRIDQTQEPVLLLPPRSTITNATFSERTIDATLEGGDVCIWDLDWRAIAARVRQSTTAQLSAEQRLRLLGETETAAHARTGLLAAHDLGGLNPGGLL